MIENYTKTPQLKKRSEKQISKADLLFKPQTTVKQVQFENQTQIAEEKENSQSNTMMQSDLNGQKRRGRKRERDDLYFIKAQERINELRA